MNTTNRVNVMGPAMIKPLVADLSKHRLEAYDFCRGKRGQGPYVLQFKKQPFILTYVASHHEHKPGPRPTFSMIEDVFRHHDFNAVIVEGVPNCEGANPKDFMDFLKEAKATNFQHGAEPAYTATLAQERGIPVYGGEPADLDTLKHVKKHGFTRDDLFHCFILRQFSQWKNEGNAWREKIDGLRAHYGETLEYVPGSQPDLAALHTWYKQNKITINPKTGEARDFNPDLGAGKLLHEKTGPRVKGACFSELLSAHVAFHRDHFILGNVITPLLNQYRNVLIVYGQGHYPPQRPVLEGMLGKPIIIRGKVL